MVPRSGHEAKLQLMMVLQLGILLFWGNRNTL